MPTIDACAHALLSDTEVLRGYLPEPWRSRAMPVLEHNDYASELAGAHPDLPADAGTAPDGLVERLDREGMRAAVLLPLTRNLHPNTDLVSAICTATNRWLAEEWLDHDSRLAGSIRINPGDPAAALAEIERWSADPRFVQVAVPAQAHAPYGQRAYFPIWQALAERELPVAIHTDGGGGTGFAPTIVGYLHKVIEYSVLQPLNSAYHLASFVAEGVFERLPGLRVVCADGALDAMTPLFWRFDKDYRGTREEIPWAKRTPSGYIRDHVRFCAHRLDRPPAGVPLERWFDVTAAGETLMYASNYPYWDMLAPEDLSLPSEVTERVLGANAAELYGLATATAAG